MPPKAATTTPMTAITALGSGGDTSIANTDLQAVTRG